MATKPAPTLSIKYEGGTIELRNASASHVIELNNASPVALNWTPADKRAIDVEVRVNLLNVPDALVGDQSAPWIRWALRSGHGNTVWDDPPTHEQLLPRTTLGADIWDAQTSVHWPVIPGRGLVHRFNTREAELLLRNSGYDGNEGFPAPAIPRAFVQVSFQPVLGLDPKQPPRVLSGIRYREFVAFPPHAYYWRAFNSYTGQPFATVAPPAPPPQLDPLTNAIMCWDRNSYLVAEIFSLGELAEWRPIPFWAASFCTPVTIPNLSIEFSNESLGE